MQPRLLELKKGILDKNDQLAARLRTRFNEAGVYVINLVSSPGSGKTELLELTLTMLNERGMRAAALVGDVATDNDAKRLARSGAPVRQIVTGGNCHLEADMIERHLDGWHLEALDFLFIENVGNLVCPASYDLGEAMRAVLLSVTEGEDKPRKYPAMFNSADLAIITKIDIAEAVGFDRRAAVESLEAVHPGLPWLEVSAKTRDGMAQWVSYLLEARVARIAALHSVT